MPGVESIMSCQCRHTSINFVRELESAWTVYRKISENISAGIWWALMRVNGNGNVKPEVMPSESKSNKTTSGEVMSVKSESESIEED